MDDVDVNNIGLKEQNTEGNELDPLTSDVARISLIDSSEKLDDFKTKFLEAIENLDLGKLEILLKEIQDRNLSDINQRSIFNSRDAQGHNAIDILFDKYVNQNLTSTDKEKIVKIICDIFNMISCKREFEITLMNRFRTLPLDKKISIFLGVLFNTNDINLNQNILDILIEGIKLLDTEQKSQILNTRFIIDADLVPEGLILNTNERKFSDYVGINILGKLFIDFIDVENKKSAAEKKINYLKEKEYMIKKSGLILQKKLEQISALKKELEDYLEPYKLSREILLGYIKKIIDIPEFNINEYVIRGSWQDIIVINTEDKSVRNKYSGMNILHLSIFENKRELFDCLLDRNNSLKNRNTRNHDLYVNFEYPMAHPEYHMVSPSKLYEDKKVNWGFLYTTFFKDHSYDFYPDNWSNSSGDSEDKESRAFKYKKWLKNLVTPIKNQPIKKSDLPDLSINEIVKKEELGNLSIEHYHGLPFMKGVYSSSQQFDIAKQIVKLCNKKTKTEKDGDKFKLLMSRTLMTSMGIENINMTLKHKENSTFKEATFRVADKLINLMKKANKYKPTVEATDYNMLKHLLNIFVQKSTKNNDKDNEFHKKFWNDLTEAGKAVVDHYAIDLKSISRYRFPFLSTSKQPDHPLKYGFGWHLESARGERPIDPRYRGVNLNERQSRHRLAGFLFVIRMDLPHYLGLVEQGKILDTVGLHKQGELRSVKKNSGAGNRSTKTGLGLIFHPQLEVTFLDCIELRDIVAAIPLVYPNYSKEFNQDWHQKVLFYNDKEFYDNYRNKKSADLQNNIKQPERQSEKESENTSLTYLAGIKNTYTHIALNIAEYRNDDASGSCSVQISPDNKLLYIDHEFTISAKRGNYERTGYTPNQDRMCSSARNDKTTNINSVAGGGGPKTP